MDKLDDSADKSPLSLEMDIKKTKMAKKQENLMSKPCDAQGATADPESINEQSDSTGRIIKLMFELRNLDDS